MPKYRRYIVVYRRLSSLVNGREWRHLHRNGWQVRSSGNYDATLRDIARGESHAVAALAIDLATDDVVHNGVTFQEAVDIRLIFHSCIREEAMRYRNWLHFEFQDPETLLSLTDGLPSHDAR